MDRLSYGEVAERLHSCDSKIPQQRFGIVLSFSQQAADFSPRGDGFSFVACVAGPGYHEQSFANSMIIRML